MSEETPKYTPIYFVEGATPCNVDRFRAITNEMAETYSRKNADYGDAYQKGYELFGYTQLLSRIYEKFCRVHHILSGNAAKVDESVAETLSDMAVQCIILKMMIEDESKD